MTATLVLDEGGDSQTFDCGSVLTLGRSKISDVVLNDRRASRNHCVIRCMDEGTFCLMDMGSSNGTFINGERVSGSRVLADGDIVRIGDQALTFHQDEVPETPTLVDGDSEEMLTMLGPTKVEEITILVSDIRGYTRISEGVSTDLLGSVLEKWTSQCGGIVERNKGVVDTFIGDAVMARWSTAKPGRGETVLSAVRTAYEINLMSRMLIREFKDLPSPLKTGAGINTGMAVFGTMRDTTRRGHTALGDSVNLAFRFETATKTLGKDIVLGPDSYAALPEELWSDKLESVPIKGKDAAVTVCAWTFVDAASILATSIKSENLRRRTEAEDTLP